MAGKKMKKKKAKSKKHKGNMSAFVAFFFVEARKRTIELYKSWYLQYKLQVKSLRLELENLSSVQNGLMRRLIQSEEEMTSKAVQLRYEHGTLHQKLDYENDPKLCRQRKIIQELFDKIHQLEDDLQVATEKERDMVAFDKASGCAALESEISKLQMDFQERKIAQEEEFEKIHRKHDMAIEISQKRAEMIISDVETVETQKEIDRLSGNAIEAMQTNIRLRKKHEKLYQEYVQMATLVKKLEGENRDFVQRNLAVDWNLLVMGRLNNKPNHDSENEDELLSLDWIDEEILSQEEELVEERPRRTSSNLSVAKKSVKRSLPVVSNKNQTAHMKANKPLKWIKEMNRSSSHVHTPQEKFTTHSIPDKMDGTRTSAGPNDVPPFNIHKPLSERSMIKTPSNANIITPDMNYVSKQLKVVKTLPGLFRYNLFMDPKLHKEQQEHRKFLLEEEEKRKKQVKQTMEPSIAMFFQNMDTIPPHPHPATETQPVDHPTNVQEMPLLDIKYAVQDLMSCEVIMRRKRMDGRNALAIVGQRQKLKPLNPKTDGPAKFINSLAKKIE